MSMSMTMPEIQTTTTARLEKRIRELDSVLLYQCERSLFTAGDIERMEQERRALQVERTRRLKAAADRVRYEQAVADLKTADAAVHCAERDLALSLNQYADDVIAALLHATATAALPGDKADRIRHGFKTLVARYRSAQEARLKAWRDKVACSPE